MKNERYFDRVEAPPEPADPCPGHDYHHGGPGKDLCWRFEGWPGDHPHWNRNVYPNRQRLWEVQKLARLEGLQASRAFGRADTFPTPPPVRERDLSSIRQTFCRLLGCAGPARRTRWTLDIAGSSVTFVTGRKDRVRMNITTEQKVTATLKPLTAAGRPAPVENVRWAFDPEGVVTAAISDDGLAATLTPVEGIEVPATAQITVTADAHVGEGDVEITGVGAITVTPAEATTLALEFGTPEPA